MRRPTALMLDLLREMAASGEPVVWDYSGGLPGTTTLGVCGVFPPTRTGLEWRGLIAVIDRPWHHAIAYAITPAGFAALEPRP